MSFYEVLDYLPVVKQRCRGVIFVAVLFVTAFSGFLTFGPIFVSVFALKLTLCQWITDTIVSTWFAMAVATYELVYGVKITVKGDVRKLSKNNSSLIVMNHRTRLDWLFYFSVQARYGSLRRFKISLKDQLKQIPGAGWAMQAANFLFLKRNWDEDRVRIEESLNHFETFHYYPQLLLFPEGTDLQPNSRAKSKSYAKKNDLQDYEYVLHPRTTGFTYVFNHMKIHNDLDQVTDVTVSYPQNIMQNETDLLNGDLPREIVFTVKCFDISEIPSDTENELAQWLTERWAVKEEQLRTFYEKRRCSDCGTNCHSVNQNVELFRDLTLYLVGALVFWTVVLMLFSWLLIFYPLARWFYLISAILYSGISAFIGVDKFLTYLAAH